MTTTWMRTRFQRLLTSNITAQRLLAAPQLEHDPEHHGDNEQDDRKCRPVADVVELDDLLVDVRPEEVRGIVGTGRGDEPRDIEGLERPDHAEDGEDEGRAGDTRPNNSW